MMGPSNHTAYNFEPVILWRIENASRGVVRKSWFIKRERVWWFWWSPAKRVSRNATAAAGERRCRETIIEAAASVSPFTTAERSAVILWGS